MDSLEQELLQDAEDDARTVEFIKHYLPQEVKDKFTDEELYYFLDVIVEYYANSGILDAAPDKDGYIEIDQDKIVDYVISQARKDKMGDFRRGGLILTYKFITAAVRFCKKCKTKPPLLHLENQPPQN